MVPIKILIHMTGLLLLTPASSDSALPMYVLMPKPHNFMPEHVAEIGYREPQENRCTGRGRRYDGQDHVCYVDINGYALELPSSAAAASSQGPARAADEPWLVDLSRHTNHPVRPDLFSSDPPGRLRSRIEFHSGSLLPDHCSVARWWFDGKQAEIANVVTWEIENGGEDRVELVLTPLHRGATERIVPPVIENNTVELFVWQVPPGERHLIRDQAGHLHGRYSAIAESSARHFHAYYSLLHVPWLKHRPIPHDPDTIVESCPWTKETRGAGTAACMVAGGTPSP